MTPWFLSKFLEGGNKGFKDILEVGALDVSPDGNQDLADFIRRFWPDANYLATDMRGGKNIDEVVNAHNLLEHFGSDKSKEEWKHNDGCDGECWPDCPPRIDNPVALDIETTCPKCHQSYALRVSG